MPIRFCAVVLSSALKSDEVAELKVSIAEAAVVLSEVNGRRALEEGTNSDNRRCGVLQHRNATRKTWMTTS